MDDENKPLKRPNKGAVVPQKKDKSPLPETKATEPIPNEEEARPLKRPSRNAAITHKRPREEEAAPAPPPNPAKRREVDNIVREHYNNVPQRGREWRSTDSKITGLRFYNNWAKSVVINKATRGVDHANVLDIGCGKGGDLQKWGPQRIQNYVGLDIADVSIAQARERYNEGLQKRRFRFNAQFEVRDCFAGSLANVPAVAAIGFDTSDGDRWGPGGGFDIVSIMFVMHYAFESEAKARELLQNVSNSLKKGGKFIGVIPNSDVISDRLEKLGRKAKEDPELAREKEWGNEIYRVRFPNPEIVPDDGIFRPPFGHKYLYWLEEAVDAPEYVIPWESLRGLAEDFNLELEYRKPLMEIWDEEGNDPDLGRLAERMRVRDRDGRVNMTRDEREAVSLYHAFIFYKT